MLWKPLDAFVTSFAEPGFLFSRQSLNLPGVTNRYGISFPALLFLARALALLYHPGLATAQQYSYKLYTVDDGLPTNAIYGGMQDSRGYIWFYTEKGVSRFDGYTFKNFTVKDGLPTNDIFMLSEDAQGRLWPYSYGRQLALIEGDSTLMIAEDTSNNFIRYAIRDDGRRIWFVDNNRKRIIVENGAGFDTIDINVQSREINERLGAVGIGYPYRWDTLVCFDPIQEHGLMASSTGEILREFRMDGLEKQLARSLSRNKHHSFDTFGNGLFIRPFTDSTLYYLDFSQKCVTPFNLVEIFGRAPEFVRYYRKDKQIQVQTDLGVFILDENLNTIDTFKVAFPPTVRIDRIFKDREGNHWITSRQKGVFFLTAEERNAKIIKTSVEEDNAILCLEGDGQGNLYIGTKKGSIYQLRKGSRMQPLLSAEPSRYNDIVETKAIATTPGGGLWISRQSIGLEYFHPASGRLEPFTRHIAQATVFNDYAKDEDYQVFGQDFLHLFAKGLAWDEQSQQLAVAKGQYPFLYNRKGPGKPTIQILSSRRTHSVAFGKDGAIWLGHADGLAVHDKNGYHYLGDDPKLGKYNIWDLAASPNGNLWIGTDGYGLFVFSEGKAIPVRGTDNDIIQDVFVGPKGKIWIATNQGVKCIMPGTPLDSSYVERILTTNNGLPTNEANAIFTDKDFIYVGTDAGLTMINRDLRFGDTMSPLLIIGQVRINGKPVPLQKNYALAHVQNELEIDFTGLSFKSFGRITYEYQLEGADRSPQRTRSRSIRYSGLQPGRYALFIKAIDIKGKASSDSAPLVFTIHPPWWTSAAGIIGWVVLAGLVAAAFYRWRIMTIQKKAQKETEINKKFAELELQALLSQMNPHFIFNSLGAIQYFIQSNDKKQADLYLSKFAYLMRLFLESSKNKFLSMAEELNLIKIYVELEQLRFKGKFEFELATDDQINPHTTMLPAMLLQPFVENSINHGLFHKEGKGHLKLSAVPTINGGLKFVVEDDGIGRQRAKELRKQSDKNYKSRALQIIGERLEALQEVEGYNIDIKVEDLYDATGQPRGTRVSIEIPEIE